MELKYYNSSAYKRFMVFIYERYYPSGGLADCVGDFDTIEEAEAFMKEHRSRSENLDLFDRVVGKYVDSEFDV
jgi:hypothetical protein